MLDQRQRRWPNTVKTLHQRIGFIWIEHGRRCNTYAPFTPVRQTIRRPLQSSVVRFSQNRSDRK